MAPENPAATGATARLGLCADCRHHVRQATRRGSVFHRCRRADEDERYLRYPPLPVRRCPGHEPVEVDEGSGGDRGRSGGPGDDGGGDRGVDRDVDRGVDRGVD